MLGLVTGGVGVPVCEHNECLLEVFKGQMRGI